ncbi:IclR family transcriptional regulator [Castellaniella caeni]|uniref:IclR family transcriptional regulator n=1 Tax=Castellaniella caeni TaxID=266123 RepID=UPI000AA99158|nr:IclR family transcriptional regulator [Castellaniella caeni]
MILTTLANVGREVTFAELKDKTGLAQSTLYRLLGQLKRWGFVTEDDGDYMPGPMCVPLAWGFDNFSYLVQEAQEVMNQLRDKTGESIGLLAAVGTRAICLGMAESAHMLRCSLSKGRSVPLRSGASAKALLAFMRPERQHEVLNQIMRDGLLDARARNELEHELVVIRRQGYATSDSEVDAGIWGISVPIMATPTAHADSVITLMAPVSRVHNQEQRLQALVLHGTQQILQKTRGAHHPMRP